jgi:geranylgeranyl diphosphate synthase, type II
VTATAHPAYLVLARYAELTRAAMAPYLTEGEPSCYLYDLVRDYPTRPGKGLRPSLLLAACQAFGGSVRSGLPAAVALEMLHSAFLVHDDIEDDSARRRGAPTLHRLHGVGLAINAGDALAALALQPLRADPILGSRISQILLGELTTAIRHTTEGQALELGWRRHAVIGLDAADYVRLAAKKTCWYTTVAPLRMGALIGSRGGSRGAALTRFGLHLGLAFQIRDDLLNLDGDPSADKDRYSDLREGKHTLMLIHLLAESTSRDRARLVDQLASPRPDGEAWMLELMYRYGSLDYARDFAAGITAAAYAAFDEAFRGVSASEHLDFLRQLIPFMVDRNH